MSTKIARRFREVAQLTRTFKIPPRDFSALRAQLNSIRWFLPPFVSVGFIEQRLREHEMRGGGTFTQDDLEAYRFGALKLAQRIVKGVDGVARGFDAHRP
jgi:hypothetical protein